MLFIPHCNLSHICFVYDFWDPFWQNFAFILHLPHRRGGGVCLKGPVNSVHNWPPYQDNGPSPPPDFGEFITMPYNNCYTIISLLKIKANILLWQIDGWQEIKTVEINRLDIKMFCWGALKCFVVKALKCFVVNPLWTEFFFSSFFGT